MLGFFFLVAENVVAIGDSPKFIGRWLGGNGGRWDETGHIKGDESVVCARL